MNDVSKVLKEIESLERKTDSRGVSFSVRNPSKDLALADVATYVLDVLKKSESILNTSNVTIASRSNHAWLANGPV